MGIVGTPLSRFLMEKIVTGAKSRQQLAGEWVDRSRRVHKISEEGWVELCGVHEEGPRFLRIHTGGLVSLRAYQLPSLHGFVKWNDAEEPEIVAITWTNGERWRRSRSSAS